MSIQDSDIDINENDFIAADVLINVAIVQEKIFKLLNARQLNSCARVCRSWREQVRREKERRKQLRWNYFLFESQCDGEDWKRQVQSFVEDSPFDPSCVLVFCTISLWAQIVEHSPPKKRKRKSETSPSELIAPYLPSKCVCQVIVSDGIVGTDADNKTNEMEDYVYAASILMIGNLPGVELTSFAMSHSEWGDLVKVWNNSSSKRPPCLKQLGNKEVKMFNLFCPMSRIDPEVGYAMFKLFGWPLLAGGFVNHTFVLDSQGQSHSTDNSCIIGGLALSGPSVHVASVVLRSHMQKEEEVNKVLKNLLDFNFPLEKSIGLMYACIGRGQHLYNKQNVESSLFRKYFPKTPLFGFFGNGEIGCTFPQPGLMPEVKDLKPDRKLVKEGDLSPAQMKRHLAEMRSKLSELRTKHVPKILHSYTTVICLISFGE